MAVTLTEEKVIPLAQSEAVVFGTVQFDNSYATGGEAVDAPGDAGYHHLSIGSQSGYVPSWDRVNQKILVYQQSAATSALTQVPNTTDLSAVTFPFVGWRTN